MTTDHSDMSAQTETKKLPVHSFFGHLLVYFITLTIRLGGWLHYPTLMQNCWLCDLQVEFLSILVFFLESDLSLEFIYDAYPILALLLHLEVITDVLVFTVLRTAHIKDYER